MIQVHLQFCYAHSYNSLVAKQQNSLTLEGEQQCHSPLSHIQTCPLAVDQIK